MLFTFQIPWAMFGIFISVSLSVPGTAGAAPNEPETISACVDRLLPKMKPDQDAREAMWDAASLCQTLISAQRAENLQQIRADNFVFQRSENTVLMWMVVAITLGGVALAAAQLLASFLLAKARGGALSESGTIDFSKDKLAMQSSFVGVLVLGLSLAFFAIYVLWVYTLDETGQQRGASRGSVETTRPSSAGSLQPLAGPPPK